MKKVFSAIMTLSLCSTVVSSEKPSNQKKEPENTTNSQKNGTTSEKMTSNILTNMNSEEFRNEVKNILSEYGLERKSKL